MCEQVVLHRHASRPRHGRTRTVQSNLIDPESERSREAHGPPNVFISTKLIIFAKQVWSCYKVNCNKLQG